MVVGASPAARRRTSPQRCDTVLPKEMTCQQGGYLRQKV
ncbi:hypothetical protein APS_0764 [Acetobacter pasteurianus subsp. pasteurianus LMG 1262 = NBRC 106471]|nr:hypothetical protein APS_0764 [Acetobacter pasteurianus subsp. pasteurianus LMG 1262 = NBRC 106471]